MNINVPDELLRLTRWFAQEGIKLYAVGGMVRNPLLGLPVSDIDVCSAMRPEEVIALCKKKDLHVALSGAAFGMVEIHIGALKTEHTTFRSDTYAEGGKHRPEAVKFSDSLETDAFRRDFTVNALYLDMGTEEVIDPTGGLEDLKARVIRATSHDPGVILRDDGLRILRLVRFACELGFSIEERTMEAAKAHVSGLLDISSERIRDELFKILLSDARYGMAKKEGGSPVLWGLMTLKDMGALAAILPELMAGEGVAQKPSHHRYDVLDHALYTAASAKPVLSQRLAALLHDVGKPEAQKRSGKMYDHDAIGANISREILTRLKCKNALIDEVCLLIRNHMYDLSGTAKESTLRAKFAALGYENAMALADIREADVHGSGIIAGRVETAARWRELLHKMKEEGAPFSENELDCTGEDIMKWLQIKASPLVGEIKHRLFMHCARQPRDNQKVKLEKLAKGMKL